MRRYLQRGPGRGDCRWRAFGCGWRGWLPGLFCVWVGGVLGPLFCRVGGLGPAALLGGEGGSPGAGVFFKFCQISKSNFFTERLWATASEVA